MRAQYNAFKVLVMHFGLVFEMRQELLRWSSLQAWLALVRWVKFMALMFGLPPSLHFYVRFAGPGGLARDGNYRPICLCNRSRSNTYLHPFYYDDDDALSAVSSKGSQS